MTHATSNCGGSVFICLLLLLLQALSPAGNLPQAETKEEKVRRLEARLLDCAAKEQVDILNELSAEYRSISIAKALEKGSASLKLARRIGYRPGEASALVQLCMGYIFQGSPSRAAALARRAMDLCSRLGDEKGYAQSVNLLGNAYFKQNRYKEALARYSDSLKTREKVGDQKGVISCLNNIGMCYARLNLYWQSLPYYQRAEQMADQLGLKERQASILCNIGVTYDHLAIFEQAMRCYQKSLKIKEEIGDRHGIAVAQNDIGGIYHTLGEYEQALDFYERSLAILEETGSKSVMATVLYNIGAVYEEMGQYERTLDYYQKSYDLARGLDDRRNIAFYQLYMGKCLVSLKRYERAAAEFRQALAIAESLAADDLLGYGWLYCGELHMESQRWDDALRAYFQAEKLGEKIKKSDIVWKALWGIGRAQEKKNRIAAAKKAYGRSIQVIEDVRSQQHTEEFRTGFMQQKVAVYESLVNLLAQQGRDRDMARAFDYVERVKARSFLDLLQLRKMGTARIPGVPVNTLPLRLRDVQSMLSEKTTLVEYFVVADKVYLFLVGRRTFKAVAVDVRREDLRQKVLRLRQPMNDYQNKRLDLAHLRFDLQAAHELYQILLAPLEQDIGLQQDGPAQGQSQVIIIPDDMLFLLPFESLVVKSRRESSSPGVLFSEYENVTFLLDSLPLSYAFSASMLDPRWTIKAGGPVRILAFSNPDPGNRPVDKGNSPQPAQGMDDLPELRSIPKTADEVAGIHSLFGAEACRTYSGKEARESVFKRESEKFAYIHLATHGVNSPANPLQSRLYFSRQDSEGEDGVLYSSEIYRLRLNCQLVVLNACETGIGKMKRGEGTISLARSFLFAGAMRVVCNLWSIEDESYPLMLQFYQNMKSGMTPHCALQLAKMEFKKKRIRLANDSWMSLSLPYLWAPSILLVR